MCMYVYLYVHYNNILHCNIHIPFLSLSLRPRICPRMRCPTITSLAGATWEALDSVCLLSNTPIARYSPPGTSGDPGEASRSRRLCVCVCVCRVSVCVCARGRAVDVDAYVCMCVYRCPDETMPSMPETSPPAPWSPRPESTEATCALDRSACCG